MAVQTSIIYITDSDLQPAIAEPCRRYLLWAAQGKRIISVSQEPLDFGDNICVGRIGKRGLNIDLQIRAGLNEVKTPFVAIAEHDCVYHPEHFDFVPPDDKHFYYNLNCWLLQFFNYTHPQHNGLFSFFPDRYVQSQLITATDLMSDATDQKIKILSDPSVQEYWPTRTRLGEPGTDAINNDWERRTRRIFHNPKLAKQYYASKKYINSCAAAKFITKVPTIDIRHGNNFTGGRRGRKRRYTLAPWGTMEDVLGRQDCSTVYLNHE